MVVGSHKYPSAQHGFIFARDAGIKKNKSSFEWGSHLYDNNDIKYCNNIIT